MDTGLRSHPWRTSAAAPAVFNMAAEDENVGRDDRHAAHHLPPEFDSDAPLMEEFGNRVRRHRDDGGMGHGDLTSEVDDDIYQGVADGHVPGNPLFDSDLGRDGVFGGDPANLSRVPGSLSNRSSVPHPPNGSQRVHHPEEVHGYDHGHASVEPPNVPRVHGSVGDPSPHTWACRGCSGMNLTCDQQGVWRCQTCSCTSYYNIYQASRHPEEHGTWVYVPHGQPSSDPPEVSAKSAAQPRRRPSSTWRWPTISWVFLRQRTGRERGADQ